MTSSAAKSSTSFRQCRLKIEQQKTSLCKSEKLIPEVQQNWEKINYSKHTMDKKNILELLQDASSHEALTLDARCQKQSAHTNYLCLQQNVTFIKSVVSQIA